MKEKFLCVLFFVLTTLGAAGQDFVVQYRCAQTEAEINKIKPQFKIINNSGSSISLSDMKIRYYFSAEGYVKSLLSIDYAQVGSSNITGTFMTDYLEIGFTSGAGTMAAGGDSGEIQLRIEKESHGFYIQSNDYSFNSAMTAWGENSKVTCYRSGTLVWGTVPPATPSPTPPPPAGDDWLHTSGSQIVDSNGKVVRLTGINWFGFETNPRGLGGLQAVNWMETFDMLTAKGFNLLRLPLSLQIVRGWMAGSDPVVEFVDGKINPTIDGVTSLKLLDHVVDYCKVVGMKIMFDMHTLVTTDIQKKVWYNSTYSVADFQSAWEWLASRYKNDDTIVAMDLFNEPHGQSWVDGSSGAKWDGSNDANNWRKAAADVALKILAKNPNLLVMVQGVECTPVEGGNYSSTDKYQYICNWWGGNLREARNYPVNLGNYQDQLVYSPHDYGPDIYVQPWFQGSFNMNSLYSDCWLPNWYYLVEEDIAPVLIGEWGGKLGGNNQVWLEALAGFINQKGLHHTFWCFNPDSGDTGGIVDSSYNFDTAKYNIVKQSLWKDNSGKFIGLDHQVRLSGTEAGTNVALYYGDYQPTNPPTRTPTRTSTRTAVSTATPSRAGKMGDVNRDGAVNIIDALMTAQYSVGLSPAGFYTANADVNEDGQINIVDALMIAQYYVGLINGF